MTRQKTTNDLHLVQESDAGKMFNTGDDKIQVLQLQGSWREMGKQYGTFAKDGMQQLWDATVQPVFNEKWATESEAEALFGRRTFDASSLRMKEFTRGIADAVGWSTDKVSLLSQGAIMGIYQAKLHSFSGCFSILAWGSATTDLTDHQIVTRPSELEVWMKIPLQTQWRYVDLKMLFTG